MRRTIALRRYKRQSRQNRQNRQRKNLQYQEQTDTTYTPGQKTFLCKLSEISNDTEQHTAANTFPPTFQKMVYTFLGIAETFIKSNATGKETLEDISKASKPLRTHGFQITIIRNIEGSIIDFEIYYNFEEALRLSELPENTATPLTERLGFEKISLPKCYQINSDDPDYLKKRNKVVGDFFKAYTQDHPETLEEIDGQLVCTIPPLLNPRS